MMPISPTMILVGLLVLSSIVNVITFTAYIGAKEDLAAERKAFSIFKASVKTMGEQAAKDAAAKTAADKKAKEKADAENLATIARLAADVARVRRERDSARGGQLPAAPAGSKCADDQACFDRASLESALREFIAGVRQLSDESATLEADLNTARRWAQAR